MSGTDSRHPRDEARLRAGMRGGPTERPESSRADDSERLERGLGGLSPRDLPEGVRPHALGALERERHARARRRWLYSIALFAAAALALLMGRRRAYDSRDELPAPAPASDIEYEIVSGGVVRGTSAARGDLMRVRAWPKGEGELRVYRDADELALRCPSTSTSCRIEGDGEQRSIRGELKLTSGRYDVVLLSGDQVPEPAGGLEGDLRAARVLGAKISRGQPVTVH